MVSLAEALQFHQTGRLQQAEKAYRELLSANPRNADALQYLGILASQVGKHDDAVRLIRNAIAINPRKSLFHFNLGNVLHNTGHPEDAAAAFGQSVALNPEDVDGYLHLGAALFDARETRAAEAAYRQATRVAPNHALAYYDLGGLLLRSGRVDEAIECLRKTTQLQPDLAVAHHNLGNALKHQNKCKAAIASFRKAIELDPNQCITHCELGMAHYYLGQLDAAAEALQTAVRCDPNHTQSLVALNHTLQQMCDWDAQAQIRPAIIAQLQREEDAGMATPILTFSNLNLSAEQQQQCVVKWVDQQLKHKGIAVAERPQVKFLPPSDVIHIGYLSSDFQSHATAFLVVELLEAHDRDRFKVSAYSYGSDDDSPMRQRIVQACDQFVDLSQLSVEQSAARIAADDVHILVDLKGHSKDSRVEMLALRPAPVQVTYIGYPATAGAEFVDYQLVDEFVVPLEQQVWFTEKLVHLPGCYQVNDSQREVADRTPTREECALPPTGFVFCCFNNCYKISKPVFEVWMKLLRAVPGSVLWLLEGNRFAPVNMRREAERLGVSPERIIIAPHLPLSEHLARHRLADLFLDTSPVNAHTTASDSLWAGCPLLTVAGETFVSRVAGSLLHALNLDELVCSDLAEYEARAMQLATDPKALESITDRLQSRRDTSSLFDGHAFARKVERAYTTMWDIYRTGLPPAPFAVSDGWDN